MNDNELRELGKKYGTPLFVFDEAHVRSRMQSIREILPEKIRICFSIKANPFLIPLMSGICDAIEVCSPGELSLCGAYGVPGEKILYSGVSRTVPDILAAIRAGASVYTAESVRQFELLGEAAIIAGKKLPVLLRLNVGSQFGMSLEDIRRILSMREEWPMLEVTGIHCFAGTQRKNRGFAWQKKELEMLTDLLRTLREETGLPLPKLEYGPGLPVPLFAGEDFSDTLSPLKEIAEDLETVSAEAELTVEAGRFFVQECGYYLTKVMDTKTVPGRDGENRYVICDGGINHVTYPGSVMGMKQAVFRHLPEGERASETEKKAWKVCGSLCTTGDELVREAMLADPHPGDLLVFENLGAYSVSEGIYLFLSRTMPGIVLYNSISDHRMVRDFTETYPFFAPQQA